jgi:pyruvate kinase
MSRPACPVIGLSPDERARRRMALYRGVIPLAIGELDRAELVARRARRAAMDAGLAREGDLVVIVYGEPVGSGVKANTVRLAVVGREGTLDSPGTMIIQR